MCRFSSLRVLAQVLAAVVVAGALAGVPARCVPFLLAGAGLRARRGPLGPGGWCSAPILAVGRHTSQHRPANGARPAHIRPGVIRSTQEPLETVVSLVGDGRIQVARLLLARRALLWGRVIALGRAIRGRTARCRALGSFRRCRARCCRGLFDRGDLGGRDGDGVRVAGRASSKGGGGRTRRDRDGEERFHKLEPIGVERLVIHLCIKHSIFVL